MNISCVPIRTITVCGFYVAVLQDLPRGAYLLVSCRWHLKNWQICCGLTVVTEIKADKQDCEKPDGADAPSDLRITERSDMKQEILLAT